MGPARRRGTPEPPARSRCPCCSSPAGIARRRPYWPRRGPTTRRHWPGELWRAQAGAVARPSAPPQAAHEQPDDAPRRSLAVAAQHRDGLLEATVTRLMRERRHDPGAEVRLRRESRAEADSAPNVVPSSAATVDANWPTHEPEPRAPAGAAATASTPTASKKTSARCRIPEPSVVMECDHPHHLHGVMRRQLADRGGNVTGPGRAGCREPAALVHDVLRFWTRTLARRSAFARP
jgi:hypothetical protein